MSAMLRGTSASSQARNIMRSLPLRTGRAVLQGMARPQTIAETSARDRNERRAHDAVLRRQVHQPADPNAALPDDIEERPSGVPSTLRRSHLAKPIPTPQKMISYAHNFLNARNEPSAIPTSPFPSLDGAHKATTFILRMNGVEVLDFTLVY